jgi:hypothetical protein
MSYSSTPSGILFPVLLLCLTGLSLLAAGCIQDSRVPVQVGTPSPVATATSAVPATPAPVTSGGTDVNVTINSILRTDLIHGAHPLDGNVFIVVDVTIENHRADTYTFTPSMINLNNGPPLNDKMNDQLETPVSWGPVQSGGTTHGEIVFGAWEKAQELTLVIYDTDGTELFRKELNEGALIGYDTSKSEKLRILMQNTNFIDVIRQLDTPLLAAQYTNEKFTFFDDRSCKGYTPQEFFSAGKGDCSDFAGFFAYALAAHGYDAKKVSYKYYDSEGTWWGHVVAVFTDKDGQLKYATTPDFTVFRNVSSLDDMISKEKVRLGFKEIVGNYRIHDPESTDVCHDGNR